MKLLVTGGLGFIGSNFILKLLTESSDYQITNVDAELIGSNKKNLKEIENNNKYEFVKGNITNKKLMEELISSSDAVINFAAESFVDRSINDANPFLISNFRPSSFNWLATSLYILYVSVQTITTISDNSVLFFVDKYDGVRTLRPSR